MRPLMRTSLALATAALAHTAQAQSLAATLSAPTELQLQEVDLYKIRVRNPVAATAFNVVARLNLPVGLELQAPVPNGCMVATEPLANPALAERQVKCSLAGIGGYKTAVFDLYIKAPIQPMANVQHRARVTTTSSSTVSWSTPIPATQYQQFSLPISPPLLVNMQSCFMNGGNAPVPYGICNVAPGQIMEGALQLAAGGMAELPGYPGPTGLTWLQLSPTMLRMDEAPDPATGSTGGTAELRLVNSRCFRGSNQPVAAPGVAPFYLGVQVCRQ